MSQVITFGLNHHSAPVAIREQVSFAEQSLAPTLQEMRAAFGRQLEEVAILSTCNRTEVYCAAKPEISEHIACWMAHVHQLKPTALRPHLFELHQDHAVRHTFRVASGLDSMVLGETQILGQMKKAVRLASEVGTMGPVLHQLFQKTFSVAKEVRSQTEIGSESVSMAAAAVRLAENVLGSLDQCQVLFIGAGEMIELCTAHFTAQHPRHITVANRTLERGEKLLARFPNEGRSSNMALVDLPDHIHEYDVVVSCTASSLPILGMGMVSQALKKRRRKPMVMVDLAVPRDIEPQVAKLSDVYLYTVDDLGDYVQQGISARQTAVVQAEAIIANRVEGFMNWMANRSVVPLIQSLNANAQALRQAELERAFKLLASGHNPEEVLERLSHNLTQKYLHAPLSMLQKSRGSERDQLMSLMPQLFPHNPHHPPK